MDPPKLCKRIVEQASGIAVFSRYEQVKCPSDVLTDSSVSDLEVPEAITVGSVIPVIVRNANSPAKFWINLVGPWFSERLNALYEEMEGFYEAQHENYYLPSSSINPGQFCVCLYAKNWLRAKILEVVHSNLVGVFFIDFGGTVFVTNDTLRFMHDSFAIVPAQCFRAYIPSVDPINSKEWPSDVCEYFRKEVSGKKVYARVVKLFRRTYTLSVELLDDNNKSIADLLILHGLAEMDRSNRSNATVISQNEHHKQDWRSSPTICVKDVGDTSHTQAVAQSPLQVDATSSRKPSCSGNRVAERSNVTCRDVTVAEKTLLLMTINSKLYFIFAEFVFTFARLHEHVALQVLDALAAQLTLWKLGPREVKMFTDALGGRSVAGLKNFRHCASTATVRLLPLSKATDVLNLLHVDDTNIRAVSTFVSAVSEGISLS